MERKAWAAQADDAAAPAGWPGALRLGGRRRRGGGVEPRHLFVGDTAASLWGAPPASAAPRPRRLPARAAAAPRLPVAAGGRLPQRVAAAAGLGSSAEEEGGGGGRWVGGGGRADRCARADAPRVLGNRDVDPPPLSVRAYWGGGGGSGRGDDLPRAPTSSTSRPQPAGSQATRPSRSRGRGGAAWPEGCVDTVFQVLGGGSGGGGGAGARARSHQFVPPRPSLDGTPNTAGHPPPPRLHHNCPDACHSARLGDWGGGVW